MLTSAPTKYLRNILHLRAIRESPLRKDRPGGRSLQKMDRAVYDRPYKKTPPFGVVFSLYQSNS